MSSNAQLDALRAALLRGLRVTLRHDQGLEAFERHQLLAIRFHRATRLNAPGDSDRGGWRRYFAEHFPRGDEYALRLWEYWRNTLLKDEFPGSGVLISHGQPTFHWRTTPAGHLYVNLESMWDDFEESVDSLIEMLKCDRARQAETVAAWARRRWSVQEFVFTSVSTPLNSTAASATSSATAI